MDAAVYAEVADAEDHHWWYVSRRKIISGALDRLNLPRSAQILEIGCGSGGNLGMLQTHGTVSAMEMDDAAIGLAQTRYPNLDIRSGHCPNMIQFSDEKFDLICMFDVLEHIEHDADTLAALKMMLSPGGRIVVTVPAYRWLWSVHDDHAHHFRRYTKGRLARDMSAAGLVPERSTYFNTLLLPIVAGVRVAFNALGREEDVGMRIPSKPSNAVLGSIFGAEAAILKAMDLPAGVSLLGVFHQA